MSEYLRFLRFIKCTGHYCKSLCFCVSFIWQIYYLFAKVNVYGGSFSHEAVTLKIRSRSPKSNKLLILSLSDLYRLANLVTFHPMGHEITCRHVWLKFGGLSLAVTLTIRLRSSKPIQLFIMSKCYIRVNLVKIRQLVHEILCTQAPFSSDLAV